MNENSLRYEYVDFLEIRIGDRLNIGQTVIEVTDNPLDGMWVRGKYVHVPGNSSLEGTEDQFFRLDVTSKA